MSVHDPSASPLLTARGICKSFPGVRALDQVSMELRRGELLCIVGENGAGKSTLMKILAGVYTPDAGELTLDGRAARIDDIRDAQRLGIALIHQELSLAESLDVASNLFLGREPRWGGPLNLIHRRIYRDAEPVMQRLGLKCSPRALVGDLSLGQRQLVEIARALCINARVLILDEPTSSLTESETEQLFKVLAGLKQDGVSMVYISHRMREIETLADRATVLRDGRNAGELARDQINHAALVNLMVGRELSRGVFQSPEVVASKAKVREQPAVAVARGLRVQQRQTRPYDLELRAGEVVGLAGLMGAGRTELAEALFGIRPLLSGTVSMDGKPLRLKTPRQAIAAGIYLIPEDRRQQGLLLDTSIERNISLPSLGRVQRLRLVNLTAERALGSKMCQQLSIRTPSPKQQAGLLSGGNQQKVVISKWLAKQPRLLILDEPTRGVDVGAKAEIYQLMHQLAADGVSVLMISSDMEEVLGVSDRVLVMHEGNLMGELSGPAMTEQAIMHLATGGNHER